jgi:hypothetical protein
MKKLPSEDSIRWHCSFRKRDMCWNDGDNWPMIQYHVPWWNYTNSLVYLDCPNYNSALLEYDRKNKIRKYNERKR